MESSDPSNRGLNCSHASNHENIKVSSSWPLTLHVEGLDKKICSDLILGNGCKVLTGNNVSSKCYHYSILVSISACSWQWPGDHSAAVCASISLNHCNTGITWDMPEFSATWEAQLARELSDHVRCQIFPAQRGNMQFFKIKYIYLDIFNS